MVLLDQQSLVRHRGPSRRALLIALTVAAAVLFGGGWLLVGKHTDRPPFAEDVAYEAGFLHASRVLKHDRDGLLAAGLRSGGCERLGRNSENDLKMSYDPGLWVKGCLDGAWGRPPVGQGIFG
ncbi:hypothetical protein [Streptomyces sp. NPDC014894]|uniref:hypothetical protein n=1 Tax=Streptomyces sp. NPDC014894 TaxID=3364931 RepID=UPI0037029F63